MEIIKYPVYFGGAAGIEVTFALGETLLRYRPKDHEPRLLGFQIGGGGLFGGKMGLGSS